MPFQLNAGDILNVGGADYRVAPRPATSGVPWVLQGQQSSVYKLVALPGQVGSLSQPPGADQLALKIFEPRYRVPGLVQLADRFTALSTVPGMQVGRRIVLSMKSHEALLRRYPDLSYAIVMPWVEGPSWMDAILQKEPVSAEISVTLARSLARTLNDMEEQGLAHGDLSGANVMVPLLADSVSADRYAIELVDIEQMYDPNRPRPVIVPPISPGYNHPQAGGQWAPEVDRFAGAVLLAEMLGWCDQRVRTAAWGAHYFDPGEMQQGGGRYELLASVLRERWGKSVASTLKRAWRAETLADCPTLGEWLAVLPAEASAPGGIYEISRAELDANNAAVGALLGLARKLRKQGDFNAALVACRQAEALRPVDVELEEDLRRQLSKITRKLEPEAPEDEEQAGRAAAVGVLAAAAVDADSVQQAEPSPPMPSTEEASTVAPMVSPVASEALPQEPARTEAVPAVLAAAAVSSAAPPASGEVGRLAPTVVETPPQVPAHTETVPVALAAATLVAAQPTPPVEAALAAPIVPETSPQEAVHAEATPVVVAAAAVASTEPPPPAPAAEADALASALPAPAPVAPTIAWDSPQAAAPPPSWAESTPERKKRRGCFSWLLLIFLGVLLGAVLYFALVVPNGRRISGYLSAILGPSAPQVTAPPATVPASPAPGETIAPGQAITETGRSGGRFGPRPPAPGETIAPGEAITETGRPGGRFGPRPPTAGETMMPGGAITGTGRPEGPLGPPPPAAAETRAEGTAAPPAEMTRMTPTAANTAVPAQRPTDTPTSSPIEASVNQLLTQIAPAAGQSGAVATPGSPGPGAAVTNTLEAALTAGTPVGVGERPSPVAGLPPSAVAAPTATLLAPRTAAAGAEGMPPPVLSSSWARPTDGMVMMAVPAGEFQMGSTDSQLDAALALCKDAGGNCSRTTFATEQPAHSVALDAFWIDSTEVTNDQFATFLNAEGTRATDVPGWVDLAGAESGLERAGERFQAKNTYGNRPVVLVSWEGANAYCQWAGAQLATEAQWEYAARGPQSSIFPWGNEFEATRLNYSSETDGYTTTAPVGSLTEGAAWSGALDMAGNAAEWVADFYGPYPADKQTSPAGPSDGDLRVTRGGSYLMAPYYARGASRGAVNLSDTNRGLGFRCARAGR